MNVGDLTVVMGLKSFGKGVTSLAICKERWQHRDGG